MPDPTRRFCIVKPRPPLNVNGRPTCDEYSVFSLDKSECLKCPNNLKASRDNLRCLSKCTDPLDIVQEDGSCFTCCNGNVPNESKTRCVKPTNTLDSGCTGPREIFNQDKTTCIACEPYTRAQRENTVCLSDQCNADQIITWQGSCADCTEGQTRLDKFTCSKAEGQVRLNAQLAAKPEEVTETAAKKEKSFPTIVVAGLGVLIMVLSAVTGMICLRGREKTNVQSAVQEEQAEAPAQNDVQSFDHLVREKQPSEEGVTDESGSNGKNSE